MTLEAIMRLAYELSKVSSGLTMLWSKSRKETTACWPISWPISRQWNTLNSVFPFMKTSADFRPSQWLWLGSVLGGVFLNHGTNSVIIHFRCCYAGQCIHAFKEWTRLLIWLVSESFLDLLSVSCQSTVRLLLSLWKWDAVFKKDCKFWCCKNTLQQSWRSARLCILIIWPKIHCGGVCIVYNLWSKATQPGSSSLQ